MASRPEQDKKKYNNKKGCSDKHSDKRNDKKKDKNRTMSDKVEKRKKDGAMKKGEKHRAIDSPQQTAAMLQSRNISGQAHETYDGPKVVDKKSVMEDGLKNLAGTSEQEATRYRAEKNISLFCDHEHMSQGEAHRYHPVTHFDALEGLLPKGLGAYWKHFQHPTPIQSQGWPFAFSGIDTIGIAETGSGKTLGFGLPAILKVAKLLSNAPSSNSATPKGRSQSSDRVVAPFVLILAPTRELAIQINDSLLSVLQCLSGPEKGLIRSLCLYGGMSKGDQLRTLLKERPNIIVGTPGRILDLLNDEAFVLSKLAFAVLDEADRMLDLGFEPDIRRIFSFAPVKEQRQTLMYSATWPTSIRKMASEYLHRPVHVIIGRNKGISGGPGEEGAVSTSSESGQASATLEQLMGVGGGVDVGGSTLSTLKGCASVTQVVQVVMEPRDRDDILCDLLRRHHSSRSSRTILFVLYKKEADRVEAMLASRGWRGQVGALHGDKSQMVRNAVLGQFKQGAISILIATDVAARGLDIPDVQFVLNYTFPLTIEDYVHRIGRTGRAGKTGLAHTLFTPLDKTHAGELVAVLRNSNQPIPPDLLSFGTATKKKEHKDYGAFYKSLDPNAKATHVKFDD